MPQGRRSWLSFLFGSTDDTAPVGASRAPQRPVERAPRAPAAAPQVLVRPKRHRLPPAPVAARRGPARVPQRIAAPASQTRMTRAALVGANNWVYQLQDIRIAQIAQCEADLAVIDYSPDGSAELAFTRDQVERMQGLDGGHRKRVIAYMSIGEAEELRFYWKDGWVKNGRPTGAAPGWLHARNDQGWNDNYKVKFWDPAWQDIIVGAPGCYLDRIIDAGFDGVYLDIVDAFEFWTEEARGKDVRKSAANDMIEFVARIAEHAWNTRGKSQFAVIPQNGEALLEHDRFRASISAVGKEDILFRMVGAADQRPALAERDEVDIRATLAHLRLAQDDGLPVIAVEYLMDREQDMANVTPAAQLMRQLRLLPYFGVRDLDRLQPASKPVAAPVVA